VELVPPEGDGLNTLICLVPDVFKSPESGVNCKAVVLINVVTRVEPLTLTSDEVTKFVPVTVRVVGALPVTKQLLLKAEIVGAGLFTVKELLVPF
jgi:hypothetical protein